MNVLETLRKLDSFPAINRGYAKYFVITVNDLSSAIIEAMAFKNEKEKELKDSGKYDTMESIRVLTTGNITYDNMASWIDKANVVNKETAESIPNRMLILISPNSPTYDPGMGAVNPYLAIFSQSLMHVGYIIVNITTSNELKPEYAPMHEILTPTPKPSLMSVETIYTNLNNPLGFEQQEDDAIKCVTVMERIKTPSKVNSDIGEYTYKLVHNKLNENDPKSALKYLQQERLKIIDGISTMKIEKPIPIEEVIGLNHVKDWVKTVFTYPIEGRKPKGILLVGYPGSGKSMLAKGIGNFIDEPVIRYTPAAVFNKYIGQTEANMRRDLDVIDLMGPVVLFIDEIEKQLSGIASSGGSDGGTTSRTLGEFISWTQDRDSDAFLIATANSFDGLPPELLRSGRFDEIFFIDLPEFEERKQMIELYASKYIGKFITIAPETSQIIASKLDEYSGADIEAISTKIYYSLARHSTEVTQEELLNMYLDIISQTKPFAKKFPEKTRQLRADKAKYSIISSR